MKSKFLGCVAILLFASPLNAQDIFTNPAVTHLIQSYGITKAEAQMRVDLQAEIMALSESLNTSGDEAYGDMYIQHEPVFKIIVLFADKADRKTFLDALDPKLRRYVQLKQAKPITRSRGSRT